TLRARLDLPPGVPTRIVSYLTERWPVAREAQPDPAPHLVFWGRLAAQKNPLRLIAIFVRVHARRPDARLTVIGPDGGLEGALRAEIARRGLEDAVTLTGPLGREGILEHAARASFQLQTSRYEGMALSVMEAMQMGLVPVVTPVGEIARYTHDGRDAVWIDAPEGGDADAEQADDRAAARILDLIEAPADWRRLREEALTRWTGAPLYAEDILAAIRDVVPAADEEAA
uniref:glycosyltransferase family 4 protein n=1 Tax=Roseobacter sp. HKCCA0434 TaxID=3079297 RepID=UPI0029059440